MKRGLRVAAIGIFVVGLALWFFGGLNLGLTHTAVIPVAGDATGAGAGQRRGNLQPGLDFLAVVAVLAGGLHWAGGRRGDP